MKNKIDDIKIFIVARDDARYILANKNNTEFTSLINYCKNSIEESDIVKA